jgi:hypothetical protein
MLGLIAKEILGESTASGNLAEGEELGSNLLRVGQRTLTNAFVVVAQSSAHPLPFYHLIGAESGHYSILSEFLKGAMNGPLVRTTKCRSQESKSMLFMPYQRSTSIIRQADVIRSPHRRSQAGWAEL